ncbi:hypothetical protein MNBD_NITROSPINAE02-1042 [hydrothermal vent metagenome]|uniref:Uncharacterized protein n=1 Tax=hydrothermal vent metagenome TaxID=652676 RepID=A0A3B1C599_9ZZZZ
MLKVMSADLPVGRKSIILRSEQKPGKPSRISVYPYDSLSVATKKYFELEKNISSDEDLVLVRAGSNESLKNAYRNYFSDTGGFVKLVDLGVERVIT